MVETHLLLFAMFGDLPTRRFECVFLVDIVSLIRHHHQESSKAIDDDNMKKEAGIEIACSVCNAAGFIASRTGPLVDQTSAALDFPSPGFEVWTLKRVGHPSYSFEEHVNCGVLYF